MTVYNPTAIRSSLLTLLQTLTGGGQPISYVYDYANPKIEGYPAIIFDIDSVDSSMLDDANNLRVINFKIWIAIEIGKQGITTAKDSLDSVTQSVVNLLEKKDNASLTGTVDWTIPSVGNRTHVDSPEGAYFSQELLLKCNIASTIL